MQPYLSNALINNDQHAQPSTSATLDKSTTSPAPVSTQQPMDESTNVVTQHPVWGRADAPTSATMYEPATAVDAAEPPSDLLPPDVHPVGARRPRWQFLAIIALVVTLIATGVGIGLTTSRRGAAATTASISGQSVATTTSAGVTLPVTVQDLQQTIISITKATQASVVEVTSTGTAGSAIGSGEFLTKDGYIVTNNHVVTGYTGYTVTLANGAIYTAQLIGQDAQDDLAVLKIAIQNATPIAIADSSQASVGEFVLAVGNPLGLQESASFGIISAVNRTEAEQGITTNGTTTAGPVLTGMIQTTAALNPGNSGGALVNLQGQLVGIPTLGASTTSSGETVSGIGFAIASNRVVYVVNQLMQSGHLTATNQGYMGVQGQDVTAASGLSATHGVVVQGFLAATNGTSPAQVAGLVVGDIITAANGQSITDSSDLAGVVLTRTPGTSITFTIQRGSSQKTITVTLGERPVQSA
jgi:putative serine protease PepD